MRPLSRVVRPLLILAAVATSFSASLASSVQAQRIDGVAAVGMTVSNMERAIAFYTKVLPFELVADTEVAGERFERLEGVFGARARIVTLRLGEELLELTEYLAPRGRPIPDDARSNDRAFQHVAIIVTDMDRAYALLRRNGVEHASSGPQRLPDWNAKAGGIRAFYFKDPDHHVLEVLQFPTGKGDERWRRAAAAAPDRLFLGIDHTAIVVGNTPASLGFYRDVLGLTVVGESENYGTEQEHLNNVFGARLRITTLHAVRGPGIELLEYLAPRDGRPYPADERSNDLIHWQTTLTTRDAAYGTARLVRDPDGHVMHIVALEPRSASAAH
jgi:catechol 2,3-dioxygenase-like lactoylglutathione lyase family enzyme